MKVAVLAGGRGSRLSEETETKSKGMVQVGGEPILWHIMQYYASFDLHEFVIALGYQADSIRAYFGANASVGNGQATNGGGCAGGAARHPWRTGDWRVELVDTGLDTQNGGRIKRLARHLGDQTFMLTWCDGVADIDLDRLLAFHRSHGRLATLTAVHPPARFGVLQLDGEQVVEFREKAALEDQWINGAYFVLEPGVMDYIDGDDTSFEHVALKRLAEDGQLMAHRHHSYWQCMDTRREADVLNALWQEGKAPWKVWV